MKLVDMTELDLNGVLFVNFPTEMSLEESRETLELTIFDIYDAEYGDWPEDERPELCISPYWVFRAILHRARREIRAMTKEERSELREYAEKARAERIQEMRKRRGLAFDKPTADLVEYAPVKIRKEG